MNSNRLIAASLLSTAILLVALATGTARSARSMTPDSARLPIVTSIPAPMLPGQSQNTLTNQYSVIAGKSLFVEYVSVHVTLPTDQKVQLFLHIENKNQSPLS